MDETFLMVPEFTEIWKWDKTKDKKKAHKVLFYIYLMCDLNDECPTKDLDQTIKDGQCRFMAYGSRHYVFDGAETDLVVQGIQAYTMLNEVAEERMLSTYDSKIDQLRDLLEETEPVIHENVNDRTGVVTFATNIEIINRALKEISNLVKAKHDLRQTILAGFSAGHVRGKVQLSPRDKRKLRIGK